MEYSAAICYIRCKNLQVSAVRLGEKPQRTNSLSLTLFSDGVIRKSEPANGVG